MARLHVHQGRTRRRSDQASLVALTTGDVFVARPAQKAALQTHNALIKKLDKKNKKCTETYQNNVRKCKTELYKSMKSPISVYC